jgi:TRAP-type uncharacterized transport system substrate-binding protein
VILQLRSIWGVLLVTILASLGSLTGAATAFESDIGLVIDAGDPVLIRMGGELSDLVKAPQGGVLVKPTMGPVANVRRILSRENVGLGIVPSDILWYTNRDPDPALRRAAKQLRFVMALGTKEVHLLARKDIHRFADLEGKRVSVGKSTSGIWVTAHNLLHFMGVKPAEAIELPPAEAILALLRDTADAAFIIDSAPSALITNILTLKDDPRFANLPQQVHLLPLTEPQMLQKYPKTTVHYPGFAEEVETISIRPTLISYNFRSRSTPYFRQRCNALARIGTTIRSRLTELQQTGHPRWQQATWVLDTELWQKDQCFYRTFSPNMVKTRDKLSLSRATRSSGI